MLVYALRPILLGQLREHANSLRITEVGGGGSHDKRVRVGMTYRLR